MKYLYWTLAILVLLVGVTTSIYFGLQPQSIPKITYSYFQNPNKVSQALLISENQELKAVPLLILGVVPGKRYQLEVWKAFLQQNELPDLKYQVLVVDPSLPEVTEVFPTAVALDVRKETTRFLEGVKNAQAQGLRMAVIVSSYNSIPLLKLNFLDVLRQQGLTPTTVTLAGFPRNPDQEKDMEIPCVFRHGDDDESTGPLGCAILNKARTVYRKKSKPGMYEGLMDQIGERDYLFLLNPP